MNNTHVIVDGKSGLFVREVAPRSYVADARPNHADFFSHHRANEIATQLYGKTALDMGMVFVQEGSAKAYMAWLGRRKKTITPKFIKAQKQRAKLRRKA